MNVGLVLIFTLTCFVLGYMLYGRRVARWYGVDPSRPTPAHRLRDNVDYSPARPAILFGHHFASIAAAGPIIGPTLALVYGVAPAWLWIVGGVIFFGAVHDFTALFISLREDGKSIAEIARRVLGKTGFFFFLAFALLLCILVAAAFVDLTARALTSHYPAAELGVTTASRYLRVVNGEVMIGGVASTSVILITLFAPVLGWLVYKKSMKTVYAVIIAALVAAFSVYVGLLFPVQLNPKLWIGIILAYTVLAAYIPVWVVLQPRDFTNVQFLYVGLLGMILGIVLMGIQGVSLQAPATYINAQSVHALGTVWPFLFVTIACGAVSGAHSLIASGTTSKQIDNERHALPIGYGGMLMESVLAICVVLSIAGGLGFHRYLSIAWPQVVGAHTTANPPLAFALGVGFTISKGFGIPVVFGTIFGILILEGFLITTIDTVIRLSRYLLEEFWQVLYEQVPALFKARMVNSVIPVALTAWLAYGHGYKAIWPIFGSANQLLAALTLVVATVWLARKAIKIWFVAIPAAFMAATTIGALISLLVRNLHQHEWPLVLTSFLLLGLAIGFVINTLKFFIQRRRAVTAAPSETG